MILGRHVAPDAARATDNQPSVSCRSSIRVSSAIATTALWSSRYSGGGRAGASPLLLSANRRRRLLISPLMPTASATLDRPPTATAQGIGDSESVLPRSAALAATVVVGSAVEVGAMVVDALVVVVGAS